MRFKKTSESITTDDLSKRITMTSKPAQDEQSWEKSKKAVPDSLLGRRPVRGSVILKQAMAGNVRTWILMQRPKLQVGENHKSESAKAESRDGRTRSSK